MSEATVLENELREANFLDSLIHLLQGNLEKVRNKSLPFQIFQTRVDNKESEKNLVL